MDWLVPAAASGSDCDPARRQGQQALCSILRAVQAVYKLYRRKDLESFAGLLLWFTCGARWLKAWLSVFFRMLHKPSLRLLQLDHGQVAKLQELLDDAMIVCRPAKLSGYPEGLETGQIRCAGSKARRGSSSVIGLVQQ